MVDRFVAGFILLCLTIPGLICSAFVIYASFTWHTSWKQHPFQIITSSKQLRKVVAYRIILQISVVEFILLFGHVVSSTMPLSDSTYGYWGKKSFYVCVLLLNAVLAFNRVFVNTQFGARSSGKIYALIIGLCYVILAVEIACYLSPYVATNFSLDTFDWVYDGALHNPLMSYIVYQEQVVAFGGIAFELVCYVAIFALITKKRTLPCTPSQSVQSSTRNPEYRILITSVVAFTYQVIMIIPFHFADFDCPAEWRIQKTSAGFDLQKEEVHADGVHSFWSKKEEQLLDSWVSNCKPSLMNAARVAQGEKYASQLYN
uniref:7TM_GPCR_Srx domain-containing protein n=1 Tax=Steinernema glaseri TaxID=37863 RepID=A0A1I7Y3K3_9BILA